MYQGDSADTHLLKIVGYNLMGGAQSSSAGTFIINLKHWDEREEARTVKMLSSSKSLPVPQASRTRKSLPSLRR